MDAITQAILAMDLQHLTREQVDYLHELRNYAQIQVLRAEAIKRGLHNA